MRVAITGSTGMVGGSLSAALRERGDTPVPVRRLGGGSRDRTDEELRWDVESGFDPPDALGGIDAVVHLAGENLGQRWTEARKRAIEQSRVQGTRRVVDAIGAADPRPAVFISPSAVGYYGATGPTVLDETAPPGDDFLANVCRVWEAEARRAEEIDGVRLVRYRFGPILARGGGMLAKMVPVFRLGIGGRVSHGRQYISWVHLDDVTAAILHALDQPQVEGVYNVTAPEPVTNRDFTDALGHALHRPTIFPVPKLAVRAVFGEMADTVLTGQRAVPRKLEATGFRFRFRRIDEALDDLLG